ncbi:MAG TPA: imidazole glycerol phosphate synthase subunit HisH, partial [Lentisphaeria bacterium]|nr:imidazole glycerol phosphate synthase subunit HisH [Lentisphaeria bacterium]
MGFIALIDYGMGNLLSVSKALEKAGGNIRIIDRPEQAEGCSGLVLPGVGNFGDGMRNLREHGFVDTVRRAVTENIPLLGICLGM